MDTHRLIDAIVRQTTVLIAQISTAEGSRSPLARVADQVFLELARELETQGVTRKVAADMFGLALRSYQKKIQRLAESTTYRDRTLWGAVVERLREGGCTRQSLLAHFKREDPLALAAVLKDLTGSGFVSTTGRGPGSYYELATEQARDALASEAELDTVTGLVWLAVYDQQQVTRAELIAALPFEAAIVARAVDALIGDARVELHAGPTPAEDVLRCTKLVIPVGAEHGWEVAVFDHFRAVCTAIAAKLRLAEARSQAGDVVGGSTLSFGLEPGHPYEREVYGLLQRVRADVNALWSRVADYNAEHALDPDRRVEVTFYFGQNVVGDDSGLVSQGESDDGE